MGRRSVRKNKNIYQLSRERRGLSREAAADMLSFVSAGRIEKIELGNTLPHPDEVLAMEHVYADAELTNHYCTHECPIGMKYMPEAKLQELPQLTVELLSALNSMEKEKDRLIDISVDGRVNDFERKQFDEILEKLLRLECSIRGMRIWIEHAAATGKLDNAE